MDKELMRLRDECNAYETFLLDDIWKISEGRLLSVRSGDKESFIQIIPLLDDLIKHTNEYKEYLNDL